MTLCGDNTAPRCSEYLFRNVKYYFIGPVPRLIEDLLNSGGGKKELYMSEMVSHVISDDSNDDEINQAKELFQLPVVKSSWVLMSVQCDFQLPTSVFDPDPKLLLFTDVVVCPSQLSESDNKVVWALVTIFGGKYQSVLNKTVTHLVTTDARGAKYEAASRHQRIKVVTPDWVTDTVERLTCVDEQCYDPRLLSSTAASGAKSTGHLSTSSVPVSQPEYSSSRSSHDPSVLHLPSSRPSSHASQQQIYGGHAHARHAGSGSDGHARHSKTGSRSSGNTKKIPFTPTPVPVMQSAPVAANSITPGSTISGVAGPAASSSAGALSSSAGALSSGSAPCYPAAAVDSRQQYYGHDPVEHVPEDVCLLGCIFYIADYQKCLEQSTLDMWRQVITNHGGQVDDSYSNRITHVLCEHQKSDVFQLALQDGKRLVTAYWLNDCLAARRMTTPFYALHFPYVFGKERPCYKQIICVTNFEGEERQRIKHMIALVGGKYTGYMSRANSIVIAKHRGGAKYEKAIEWNIPVVGIEWLNDLILGDLNVLKLPIQTQYTSLTLRNGFHVDSNKVAHLLEGWKTPVKISKETWKKFQSTLSQRPSHRNTGNEQTYDVNHDGSPEKMARLALNVGQKTPVVLLTGFTKDVAAALSTDVMRLGGQLVQSAASTCTHLVANTVLRTVKFLTAVGVVQHIITGNWIEQSVLAGRFLDETGFELRDEKMESTFHFQLQESLRRARAHKLFQDMTFYVTPGVVPNKGLLATVIQSCAGNVVDNLPPLQNVKRLFNSKGEPSFVIISCSEDLYLCHEIISHNIAIHNVEFVLTGVMRQQIDSNLHRIA